MKIKKVNRETIEVAKLCLEKLHSGEVSFDMESYYYFDETIGRLQQLIKEVENLNDRIELLERINELERELEKR